MARRRRQDESTGRPPSRRTSSVPGDARGVSIILPAYDSQQTLDACLAAVRAQTLGGFETIVVDSSPHPACERIVRDRHPWVRYVGSAARLVPHAAQNAGVAQARGDILVFLDPDVYPAPDWLERMLGAHARHGRAVVGAIGCHGAGWLETAIHLCKFGEWLPGGAPRPVAIAPSTSFLIARRDLAAVGGFPGTPFFGDVELSRRLCAAGAPPWLEPSAVVRHHHRQGIVAFLRERIARGRRYGALRGTWRPDDGIATLAMVAASPLRLGRILWLAAGRARRAGEGARFLRGLPVVFAGHAAWLAGEAAATMRGRRRARLRPPIPRGAS